jgi:hypothetical protein
MPRIDFQFRIFANTGLLGERGRFSKNSNAKIKAGNSDYQEHEHPTGIF